MSSKIQQLTPQAISQLVRGDAEEESIVVQLYNIKMKPNGKFTCSVSDGYFYINAFIDEDVPIKEGDQNSIVCIKSHAALSAFIGITKIVRIGKYPEKIGQPKDWITYKENAELLNSYQSLKFKLDKLSLGGGQGNPGQVKTEKKDIKSQVKQERTEPKKISQQKVRTYQSFDDLYIGLKRWTLLCRIARKTLKETAKKGIKVLELELVDSSRKKIMGTFFNESAVEYDEFLKEGAVYEVSKGWIKEGNYNNSRNQKYSPYILSFDSRSSFVEVSDFHIISKNEDTAITLGAVYQKFVIQQEFDVVAYVVEIKEQTTIQINNKEKRVRELTLADPDAKITMCAKLWGWNSQVDSNWVRKVLIFSRFSLRKTRNSLYLCNGQSSSILTSHDHPMKKYEGKTLDTSCYKQTTDDSWQANAKKQQDILNACKNIGELNKKMQTLYENQGLSSVVNVWISRFAFNRKWCYEACPKCNKAAEKHSKCSNCGNTIDDTIMKFVLGVEVSDFCGGLWVTAYDSFAKKIFADMGANPVVKLQALNKDELSDVQQKYLYQAHRLKIVTKKDVQGRVKHQAGHLFEIQEKKLTEDNLKQIKEFMSY